MFNWQCPYCGKHQTVTDVNSRVEITDISIPEQIEGKLSTGISSIRCSNGDCLRTTINISIKDCPIWEKSNFFILRKKSIFDQCVLPSGSFKPQPEYVPQSIQEDYYEACKIKDLSPKASATLIRRCLQGMIRDFAKISRGTLNAEILELKKQVESGEADRAITAESVEAIDYIRGVGNIGAHMEKDINLIIEVDPNEAEALIQVSEMLFDEWYGERHRRQERLAKVKSISEDKAEQKKQLSAPEN